MTAQEDQLVDELVAAHRDTVEQTAKLAAARQRRRDLAAQLHAAGRSYAWIGHRLGITAQAVEGFLKYHQRRHRDSL